MRTSLLYLHILAAGIWLGANMTQALMAPRMGRAGGNAAADYYRATVAMGTRLYMPAAIVSLLTGIGLLLVENSPYSFGSAFVSVGFAMVLIGAVLGVKVFGPQGEKAAQLSAAGDASALAPVAARLRSVGMIDSVLLLLTIAAMVWKLGA